MQSFKFTLILCFLCFLGLVRGESTYESLPPAPNDPCFNATQLMRCFEYFFEPNHDDPRQDMHDDMSRWCPGTNKWFTVNIDAGWWSIPDCWMGARDHIMQSLERGDRSGKYYQVGGTMGHWHADKEGEHVTCRVQYGSYYFDPGNNEYEGNDFTETCAEECLTPRILKPDIHKMVAEGKDHRTFGQCVVDDDWERVAGWTEDGPDEK